ncbi:L-aminoadipate-semialdehyde dehydrogenase-phosphopantetheinyl transferase, partial [Pseudolycoriella hygida]
NGHARWAFDLSTWRPTLNELLLATSCIQTEEKSRLVKFMFREDFDGSIIGRLLMRKFVQNTTKLPYEQIQFARDARGKPHLMETESLSSNYVDFNVSHQGSYAVLAGCCLSSDNHKSQQLSPTIGVDVMKIEYTGDELGQTEAFMRHWCLKESYVKNVGVGITMNLQKIDFTINTDKLSTDRTVTDTVVAVNDNLLSDWVFEESLIDEQHCVAVAVQNHNDLSNAYNFQLITFEELTRDATPLLDVDRKYCLDVLSKPYKNS